MRFVRFSLDWASNGTYKFTEDAPFHPIASTVPTSIDAAPSAGNVDTTIYDLSGRKVQKAGKGVYIMNGKKVIF